MILQRLKHDTRELHAQIEQRVDLPVRLRSWEGYREVLAQFYGYYAPVEAALKGVTGLDRVIGDLSVRWKAGQLVADLQVLGVAPSAIASLPHCVDFPHPSGLDHAFGCLYVLEGATLGGQIITRQITGDLGVTPTQGAAFFAGYGPATGPMWRSFGAAVMAYATTPEREATIVAAAQATFQALDRWMAGGS